MKKSGQGGVTSVNYAGEPPAAPILASHLNARGRPSVHTVYSTVLTNNFRPSMLKPDFSEQVDCLGAGEVGEIDETPGGRRRS